MVMLLLLLRCYKKALCLPKAAGPAGPPPAAPPAAAPPAPKSERLAELNLARLD